MMEYISQPLIPDKIHNIMISESGIHFYRQSFQKKKITPISVFGKNFICKYVGYYASRMIRYHLLIREAALELGQTNDHALDPLCVKDFCDFMNYSEKVFWGVIYRQFNRNLFNKNVDGRWVLKIN